MFERRGPRGSGGWKSPSGVQGQSPGSGSGGRFFVTECLNFDVLEEEKLVKQPKIPS